MHILRRSTYMISAKQMHCEVELMGKFKIPSIPPTVNKTIRFPSDIVNKVEKTIRGKECTFSAFVIAAVRAALDDLECHNEVSVAERKEN